MWFCVAGHTKNHRVSCSGMVTVVTVECAWILVLFSHSDRALVCVSVCVCESEGQKDHWCVCVSVSVSEGQRPLVGTFM